MTTTRAPRAAAGFCAQCPDHEGCATGIPCAVVKAAHHVPGGHRDPDPQDADSVRHRLAQSARMGHDLYRLLSTAMDDANTAEARLARVRDWANRLPDPALASEVLALLDQPVSEQEKAAAGAVAGLNPDSLSGSGAGAVGG